MARKKQAPAVPPGDASSPPVGGRLDRRSALGSFAVARHFPDHRHTGGSARYCTVCGSLGDPADNCPEDLSVLNFERFKWGGVRHLHPIYAALDLELFAKGEKPVP